MAAPVKQKMMNTQDIPLRGSTDAPEIFVDGYQGASVVNGVVKIHFHTTKFDPLTEGMVRQVVFTMVVPAVALAQISGSLNDLIESLKRDGLLIEAPIPPAVKTNA
ncbi:MAG: hypothetical protein WB760_05210 [Xanthobacteraceae bacterium]